MSQKSKSIIKISSVDEFEQLIVEGPVIVNITASWCGACRFFDSTLIKISREYSRIKFLKIDLDEAEEAMSDLIEHVSNVPHFDLYRDGIKIGEYCGSKADQLKIAIEKLEPKLDHVENAILNSQTLDHFNKLKSEPGEKKEMEKNSNQNHNSEIKESFDKLVEDIKSVESVQKEGKLSEDVTDSKSVITILDLEQFKELISNMASLVYIHDPACSLSVFINPLFNQLADENPEIKFLKIHVEKAREKMLIELEHVCATPHFELYKNGSKIHQYCGADEFKLNEAVSLFKKLLIDPSKVEEIRLNDEKQGNRNIMFIDSIEEFKDKTSTGASLVHYLADWCRPSLSIKPIMESLASRNKNIKFIQIDFDKAKLSMPNQISHITSIPYFELYLNGEKIGEFLGDNVVKLKKSIKLLESKIN